MNPNRSRLAQVAGFLETETTLALATATMEGAARVTPLFYLPEEGPRLYWFSSPSSDHSRNLKHNPQCAVTIYHPADDWKKIRGVQMRGAASPVSDAALRGAVVKAYCDRFHLGKLFETQISRSALYCFAPEWVRYIDNSRRFGYKFELHFGAVSARSAAPPARRR